MSEFVALDCNDWSSVAVDNHEARRLTIVGWVGNLGLEIRVENPISDQQITLTLSAPVVNAFYTELERRLVDAGVTMRDGTSERLHAAERVIRKAYDALYDNAGELNTNDVGAVLAHYLIKGRELSS